MIMIVGLMEAIVAIISILVLVIPKIQEQIHVLVMYKLALRMEKPVVSIVVLTEHAQIGVH